MTEEIQEINTKLSKHQLTASLEPCKSKFFSNDASFLNDIIDNNFQVYYGEYVDIADYDGKPEFIVKNLVKGFVQQLDNERKNLFTAFKCTKDENYQISSLWICNCVSPLVEIVPSMNENFALEKLNINDADDVTKILSIFNKNDNDPKLVTIQFLH